MQTKCSIPDCDNPAAAHSWCRKHWYRWRRHGDPAFTKRAAPRWTKRTPAIERFLAKIAVSGTPPYCWEWLGARDKRSGYSIFASPEGQSGHRFAYAYFVDPCLPDTLTIDHICRNHGCVNPAHLEAVPSGVNVLRGLGLSAMNARKTHCKRGHPFDEANTKRDWRGNRMCGACYVASYKRSNAKQRQRRQASHPLFR